jgi:Pvc16 N-terminal domain
VRSRITPWAASPASEYFMAGHHAEMGSPFLVGSSWVRDDSVQVILETLPIEDHTRIWDTIHKPYRLSLTYLVRVVGIDPDPAFAQDAPPILNATFGARS